MRIKILRTLGKKDTLPKSAEPTSLELPAKKDGTLPKEGEVCEFKDDDAEKYIKCGMGEATDEAVGPPPAPFPMFGQAPIPVMVVEPPKAAATHAAPHHAPARSTGNYDEMSVEELHKEASDRQLEGRSALTTKADLIKALTKDDVKGKK